MPYLQPTLEHQCNHWHRNHQRSCCITISVHACTNWGLKCANTISSALNETAKSAPILTINKWSVIHSDQFNCHNMYTHENQNEPWISEAKPMQIIVQLFCIFYRICPWSKTKTRYHGWPQYWRNIFEHDWTYPHIQNKTHHTAQASPRESWRQFLVSCMSVAAGLVWHVHSILWWLVNYTCMEISEWGVMAIILNRTISKKIFMGKCWARFGARGLGLARCR